MLRVLIIFLLITSPAAADVIITDDGKILVEVAGGAIDTETDDFLVDTGGGYINTETGEYHPDSDKGE